MPEQAFDFDNIGFGMLATDAFAGDVARHLVQIQRHREPLFAGHLAIAFDLFVQCRGRSHGWFNKPCGSQLQVVIRYRTLRYIIAKVFE